MKFIEIDWNSARYEQELDFRDRLLRTPLGLSFDQAEVDAEREQLHFGLIDARDVLVACVVAVPLRENRVKLRQMAVETELQGQGVGSALIARTEQLLVERGFETVELNARDEAVGFYEKLGYAKQGEPFIEVTIPHFKMVKLIP